MYKRLILIVFWVFISCVIYLEYSNMNNPKLPLEDHWEEEESKEEICLKD